MKRNSILLAFGVVLATCAAIAKATPSSCDRLAALGRHYGDAAGSIPIATATDGLKYVATAEGRDPFSIYSMGDAVDDDATLAVCAIDTAGALVGCDPAYGETMLYALEDLQSSEPDPGEMTIECHVLFGSTGHCKVTWSDDGASCYTCSGERCVKSAC